MKYKAGDDAYFIENNRMVTPVHIKSVSGGFCLIQFENGGGIRVKEHRLFQTEDEARLSIGLPPTKKTKYISPYDI